ncbi:MAG: DMT family transporter [Myxococcales bacterium]|nr:DMT family transporter [Myxococcales bacterium]
MTTAPDFQLRGSLAIGLSASLWGLWGLAIHFSGIAGPLAGCIALITMGTCAVPWLPRRIPRGFAAWWPLWATGITDAANAWLYFEALHRGPVPVAVLSHYLAPVLVALGSPLILRRWPSWQVVVALPVALLGLGLLLGGDVLAIGPAALTGLLGAASAFFYAAQVLILKRSGSVLTPAELLVWHTWIGGLLLLPVALMAPTPTLGGVVWIMGGAALAGTLGGLFFLWGLQHVSAAKAGVLTYLEPMVGVASGALVLGDRLPALAPLGGLLILASGLWVVRAPVGGAVSGSAAPPAAPPPRRP